MCFFNINYSLEPSCHMPMGHLFTAMHWVVKVTTMGITIRLINQYAMDMQCMASSAFLNSMWQQAFKCSAEKNYNKFLRR